MALVGYIYLVTNLVSGRKYVGLTKGIDKRWGEHKSAARTGSPYPLHRAMRKHGAQNFRVTCLEVVDGTHGDLLAAEVRQITSHDCVAPKGYNLTRGGEGVDLSVPGVYERMIAGARKRSANPEWQKNVVEAAKRRANDPDCQAKLRSGVRKRTADPCWQKNVAEGARKRSSEPGFRDACSRGAQRRLSSPEWREANLKQLAAQHADPEWQAANKAGLRKAQAVASARAKARDAHLPPEDQARRAKRREIDRLYQARKRARHPNIIGDQS
jgi:hypothetical protein